MARTENERKAAERASKRAAGLVPKEIWTRPEHWPSVKRYVERLNRKRAAGQEGA